MKIIINIILLLTISGPLLAYNGEEGHDVNGPYATSMDNFNTVAADAGIAGFTGPLGRGMCPPGDNDQEPTEVDPNLVNVINPVFSHWAVAYQDYIPAPAVDVRFIGNEKYSPTGGVPAIWRKPQEALGAVTGDNFNVCVLGDLWPTQLAVLDPEDANYTANQELEETDPYKINPGRITLVFDQAISNGPGPDFAVFENGFISAGGAGVGGQIFAELGFVEVSSDGNSFVRFPSVSLTEKVEEDGGTGPYGTIDPTNVYNLAGKHVNAYQSSWGTPFNLSDLANLPEVLDGTVNLNAIRYVRVVDIPGNGFFSDNADSMIDPTTIDLETGLGGTFYQDCHGIHDAWVTWGSGGFDLEAIGAINQIYGDANSDGKVNLQDFIRLALRWQSYGNWPQGDFDEDKYIGIDDLCLLVSNWTYVSE